MRNGDKDRQTLEFVHSAEPELGRAPAPGMIAERLLLREFTHRTNNEFAFAIGSISLAAGRCESEEARAALSRVIDRLESHASIQHFLQPPEYSTTIDVSTYIYTLCQAISRSKLEQKGIELALSRYALKMNSERCWFLGMIVFELITNAARHAFSGTPGTIRIEVYPAGSSVTCRVTDNGRSDSNPTRGQGLAIIEALAAGLGATLDTQRGPTGTTTTVRFPT